jgi:CNT family concentrative nucleoside transporter
MLVLQSLAGLFALAGIAWIFSENRSAVSGKQALLGIALQLGLGLVLLKAPGSQALFLALNNMVLALETATRGATSFVFGYIGGGPAPFEVKHPEASFVFAFQGLPIILVVSAISSALYYWGVLPVVVRGFGWGLRKTMGIGGAAGLSSAATVFLGMVEGPLLVRPYLKEMTRGELFLIMTCGMATIAGNMMVVYAQILGPVIPGAMGHIMAASLISVPAAITVAHIMIPETNTPTAGEMAPATRYAGTMDAIAQGTADGLGLTLNIVAMLIVLVALVGGVNGALSLAPAVAGEALTLQRILGWAMAPVVWLTGVPWSEAVAAGGLMGIKTALNEFIAYLTMAQLPKGTLSARTELIMTYSMCGFANFGSAGILIGGLGAMAPERRGEIAALGFKAIVSGTIATLMTGAVVGIIG